MTVRGVEAIKMYMPPTSADINSDIQEEKDRDARFETMNSADRYRHEWLTLLHILHQNPDHIKEMAHKAMLKVSKFRSVYWAILLHVLSAEHASWRVERQLQRKRYEKLQEEFIRNPREMQTVDDDPLSQSTQSIWNQYFSNQELFGMIRQDVVRTFPGVDFFRKPAIQNAMANILFYYAREHPYLCYRQGMHEILAPILFVVYGDHQALLHFKEVAPCDIDEILLDVLNAECLEADAYSIFSRLMSLMESYYRVTSFTQHDPDFYAVQNTTPNAASTEVEIVGQLHFIRDKILAKEDLHLYNYLLKLDIPLHIFGIRWLRLLFGREFPLLDLLILWDAIFADSDHFDLPNYILVAMLIRIRDKLLLSDYTTCLSYLMRYPTNIDINVILSHALHMKMPKKFDCPPNAFVYFTINPACSESTKLQTSLSKTTTFSRKPTRNIVQQQAEKQRRASSLDSSTDEKPKVHLQARDGAESTNNSGNTLGGSDVLVKELKNAQAIIKNSHNKLQNYLKTVRKHTLKHNSVELTEALDGIEELCSYLNTSPMFSSQPRSTPVDQAMEANEQQQMQLLAHAEAFSSVASANQMKTHISDSLIPYEKPENDSMIYSSRILGSLKEIELIPITSSEQLISINKSEMPIQNPLAPRRACD